MHRNRVTIEEAVKFHGHLGPYLVLGIMAGEIAIKKIRCRKHFGLAVKVYGVNQKPKSCLIDGLQLSTGATYGKGNIKKINAKRIRIAFCNLNSKKKAAITLKEGTINKLSGLKGHMDSETFAKKLYKTSPLKIFNLKTYDL